MRGAVEAVSPTLKSSVSKLSRARLPLECSRWRSYLVEAAHVLLTRKRGTCRLKRWGLKLGRRRGMAKLGSPSRARSPFSFTISGSRERPTRPPPENGTKEARSQICDGSRKGASEHRIASQTCGLTAHFQIATGSSENILWLNPPLPRLVAETQLANTA